MSEEQFNSRWRLDDLELVDPILYEAILDQQAMLKEHTEAMARGWAAALERMEEAEIAKAKAIFPGAKVTAIREKPTPDVSGGERVS